MSYSSSHLSGRSHDLLGINFQAHDSDAMLTSSNSYIYFQINFGLILGWPGPLSGLRAGPIRSEGTVGLVFLRSSHCIGTDNRPPMLEKSLYDSWKSRMEFYMENRVNGRIILDSVLNGLLVWPTITQEDGTTRRKTYAEFSATEKLQADWDCKATNIVLQGLPPDMYAIVNHHKVAKEI
ncbi:hypothetical protein Tco_0155417 [Tanacetum coccineum]